MKNRLPNVSALKLLRETSREETGSRKRTPHSSVLFPESVALRSDRVVVVRPCFRRNARLIFVYELLKIGAYGWRIPRVFINDLLARTDIVDLIMPV